MQARHSLGFRLLATGACFLVVGLASIVLTLWVTWQLEGGAAAVNEAGRMRMMSYHLALDAAHGRRDALAPRMRVMDSTLDLLQAGDPSRPLFVPWGEASRAEFIAVREAWQPLRAVWATPTGAADSTQVDALVERIDRFVSLIEQRMSRWTEVLRAVQLAMVGLAIASAVLLMYSAQRMVLDPLRRLGQGLGAIRAGDFGARVQMDSDDEFAELAEGFNAMAVRLQSLYGDLEAKVRSKTASLEVKRERLAALYEVSAFVTQAGTLDELASGFVQKVRRIARADAVAVRWADEDNEHYLMLAQEGLPPALVQGEQCLPSGHCGCGQGARAATTRVIQIQALAQGAGHCQRAGFETVLSVPVMLHQRVLGEVDLFFRAPHGLQDDDREMLDTLASHLAGGIESLRATAAGREAAVANERALLAQELHDSIAQSLAFLKIQVDLLRNAVRRGDADATNRTVAEIDAGVRESYADVRELLLHFRTRTDAQDIEGALRNTLQKFEQQTGLPTTLQVHGRGVPLPTDVQVQLLHVVQEALSNVRKHAHATSVTVRLQRTPEWHVEVEDDGCGFDNSAPPGDTHVGLRIMAERAQRIGADVTVSTAPGRGTRVAITVPRGVDTPVQAEPPPTHHAVS